jgi:hypothetical protein
MKIFRKLFLTMLFLFTSLFMVSVFADEPLDNPPPPPGGGHGGGGNSQGAPIDGGVSILLALGAGYGSFKLYKKRKSDKNVLTIQRCDQN